MEVFVWPFTFSSVQHCSNISANRHFNSLPISLCPAVDQSLAHQSPNPANLLTNQSNLSYLSVCLLWLVTKCGFITESVNFEGTTESCICVHTMLNWDITNISNKSQITISLEGLTICTAYNSVSSLLTSQTATEESSCFLDGQICKKCHVRDQPGTNLGFFKIGALQGPVLCWFPQEHLCPPSH